MGKILPHFQSMLGSLSLSVFTISLTACTVDHTPEEEPPEINAYSSYIDGNTIKHLTYTDETTSVFTLATFSEAQEGYDLALELDTDEEIQGYEFATYVKGFPSNENKNEIHILHYDKSLNAETKLMSTVTGTICGIKPVFMPSSYAFTDRRASSNRALKNASEIILQVAESDEDCLDTEKVYFERLDFSNYLQSLVDIEEDGTSDIHKNDYFSRNTISRHQANATLIVDYSSSIDKKYGYLTNNPNAGLTFVYYASDEQFTWQTDQLTEELHISQAAENEILIYSDSGEVRVIDTQSLFTIGDTEENNSIDTPIQKQIDALFETPITTLDTPSTLTSTNTYTLSRVFTMLVNNELYFFNRNSVQDPPLIKVTNSQFSEANKTIVEHEVHDSGNIVVITKDESAKFQGSTFNPDTKAESSLMEGLQSDAIDLIMRREEMYINTLNLGNNVGWQAHNFEIKDNNFTYETYENTHRLLSFKDLQEEEDSLYLLGLDTTPNNHDESELFETSGTLLFQFSKTEDDGRFKAASEKTNLRADYSYGWFNEFAYDIFDVNAIVINDEFARIEFTTSELSASETKNQSLYLLDPTENEDIPDPSFSEQSLKLVISKTL